MGAITEPPVLPTEWKPEWQDWPKTGEWPLYSLGERSHHWRNGREAGAWISGIVCGIQEKCALVEIEKDWIAGAILAMLEGGLCIGPYSSGSESATYEVWVAHLPWGPERIQDFPYEPAAK